MTHSKKLSLHPEPRGTLPRCRCDCDARGKVAIVEPDYYANRKLVHFSRELYPIELDYLNHQNEAGINLETLEDSFKAGVKTFIFSNPNNPSGVVYSEDEITKIAQLVKQYG